MTIKVIELFAGVGGFRCGLEKSSLEFETIWANQWEPGRKNQHAFDCYISHFGNNPNHVNEDISNVKDRIPNHDLLVGGFPCQDYSVARTSAKGIEGKKGILWWEINSIVNVKKPNYVLLENVDRLIKSPSNQRGRDFAVILRCLNDAGYAVEWRVINAAEFGFAQRRRRIFIFAYKNTTPFYLNLSKSIKKNAGFSNWILTNGFFAPAFPLREINAKNKAISTKIDAYLYDDLATLSTNFKSVFYNAGVMINGVVYSTETIPAEYNPTKLGDILLKEIVDPKYFLNGSTEKWVFLKGAKKIERVRPNGEPYHYAEGGMCFPDNLEAAARTMLTSESSVNRSSHVVKDFITGRLRLLTPVECERINGFPDGWTNSGMPEKFRYFTMGNALVVPVITKLGNRILEII